MAIGGVVSIFLLAVLRETAPGTVVGAIISCVYPNTLVISDQLRLDTIGDLSVLQAGGLIMSQSIIGIVSGYLIGTFRYALIDKDKKSRKDLEKPWETMSGLVGTGDQISVITTSGVQVDGYIEQMGSSEGDYNLLISGPKESGNLPHFSDNGDKPQVMYLDNQDISRMSVYTSPPAPSRSFFEKVHYALLQKLISIRQGDINISSQTGITADKIDFGGSIKVKRENESYIAVYDDMNNSLEESTDEGSSDED